MESNIFDVVKSYQHELKNMHQSNVEEKFDELVKTSKIDIEENKKTIAKIKSLGMGIESISKKLSNLKSLRAFLWVVFAIGIILLVDILFMTMTTLIMIVVIVSSIILITSSISVNLTVVKRKIIELSTSESEKTKEREELIELSWDQMEDLNNLYEWSIPQDLVMKTAPVLKFDSYLNNKSFSFLKERYELSEDLVKENESALLVKSGTIYGNPFLFLKKKVHEIGQKDYEGSLYITWTETVRDSDGKTRTVTKSQTLVATVTKPFPVYENKITLLFFSDATPNLSFSRVPSGVNGMNEKQMESHIAKETKALNKMAKNAIKKNQTFNLMNNYEFESLFGAQNRNDEIEFRMLFSSLGQRQMLDLIKDKKVGYGDNFYFEKTNKTNRITSKHLYSEYSNLDSNPENFINNNYEAAKEYFTKFNARYFKDILFALAPVLSIPLYQEYKSTEYIYELDDYHYTSNWEKESIANDFKDYELRPENTRTELLLKTTSMSKDNYTENVEVVANSYLEEEMVEYVTKRGRDGHLHDVPVPWIKYTPTSKKTNIIIKNNAELSRNQFYTNWKNDDEFRESFSKAELSQNKFLFRDKVISFIKGKDEYEPSIAELINEKIK